MTIFYPCQLGYYSQWALLPFTSLPFFLFRVQGNGGGKLQIEHRCWSALLEARLLPNPYPAGRQQSSYGRYFCDIGKDGFIRHGFGTFGHFRSLRDFGLPLKLTRLGSQGVSTLMPLWGFLARPWNISPSSSQERATCLMSRGLCAESEGNLSLQLRVSFFFLLKVCSFSFFAPRWENHHPNLSWCA